MIALDIVRTLFLIFRKIEILDFGSIRVYQTEKNTQETTQNECHVSVSTQYRDFTIFDYREKIRFSTENFRILIIEITISKSSFRVFSSGAGESPYNSTDFMSRKVFPKITLSRISDSFKNTDPLKFKKSSFGKSAGRGARYGRDEPPPPHAFYAFCVNYQGSV